MKTKQSLAAVSLKTHFYHADPSAFGGVIYPSDFDTNSGGRDNFKGSPIARRILSDWKFDEQCGRNLAFRSMTNEKGGNAHA